MPELSYDELRKEVVLYIKPDQDADRCFAHVILIPQTRVFKGNDWELEGIYTYSDSNDLDGLQIRCQISDGNAYAFEVEYRDIFSVSLRKAEAMAKQLRKIDKHLEKVRATLGYPTTFTQYALRVAQALKVTTFAARASVHSGGDVRYMNPSEAESTIDHYIHKMVIGERINA